jgi:nucleoside phosphorylase
MATENEHKTSAFTIGWIAALSHELTAARMMLDEEYLDDPDDFNQSTIDRNTYTWGRICKHLVVIAVLPSGRYGIGAAQAAATGMLASLPNIRVGLMVGIGAGVPSAGIRLGDVVVSQPEGTHGGVVQYDAYKAKVVGTQQLEELRGFLNAPPDALLATLSRLKSTHDMGDSAIATFLEEAFEKRPQMKKKFGYPGASHNDPEQPAVRDALPELHYGTVASGEVLFKNAEERDAVLERLHKANIKALCFEMEAAGLMNSFPCLVIRGICDYADGRKNDAWQNYAAMMAAAFAKDFLKHVQKKRIEQTPTIGEAVQQSK